MSPTSNRQFVKSAWVLLLFQLAAAAIAVGATAWASFKVRPLVVEKERLEQEVEHRRDQAAALKTQYDKATTEYESLGKQLQLLREQLTSARKSTPALTDAINAFHRRQYPRAIEKYDDALRLNPGDAYIYNLKSYSQFKSGDAPGAIGTMSKSLELDPSYAWGYFDLARFQCAAGTPIDATRTLKDAAVKQGESVKRLASLFLQQDGEFRRLCASALPEMRSALDL
jgi:tetratricopeptide (TPR) repeat protein